MISALVDYLNHLRTLLLLIVNFQDYNRPNNLLLMSSDYLSPSMNELPVEIDFDEASRAWRQNKKDIGNGSFVYVDVPSTPTKSQYQRYQRRPQPTIDHEPVVQRYALRSVARAGRKRFEDLANNERKRLEDLANNRQKEMASVPQEKEMASVPQEKKMASVPQAPRPTIVHEPVVHRHRYNLRSVARARRKRFEDLANNNQQKMASVPQARRTVYT